MINLDSLFLYIINIFSWVVPSGPLLHSLPSILCINNTHFSPSTSQYLQHHFHSLTMCTSDVKLASPSIAKINGRPVLQPSSCNRVSSLKKPSSPPLDRNKSKSFKDSSASLTYSSSLIVESPGSIAAVRREQMALQNAQRKMRIAHYGRSKSAKFDSNKVVPLDANDNNSSPSFTSPDHDLSQKRCSFITANSDPIYVDYHDHEWGVPVHNDKYVFSRFLFTSQIPLMMAYSLTWF